MLNVYEIIRDHVSLSITCVDRLYINGYLPGLQTSGQLCYFLKEHLGNPIPSPALLGPMHDTFVAAVDDFAARHHIPVVQFQWRQSLQAALWGDCFQVAGDQAVAVLLCRCVQASDQVANRRDDLLETLVRRVRPEQLGHERGSCPQYPDRGRAGIALPGALEAPETYLPTTPTAPTMKDSIHASTALTFSRFSVRSSSSRR